MKARFSWLLGKGSNKPSAARKRTTVRPSVEGLEQREVLSSYWLGSYTAPGGYYPAGLQHVSFFVLEVHGSFTQSNASSAWSAAMNASRGHHGTLVNNADVLDRTVKSGSDPHFELVGYENTDTGRGGWLAARYDTTWGQLVTSGPWWNRTTTVVYHSTMDWMSNGGQHQENVEGPFTMNYTANGYHVGLYMSPDSSGNMHAAFNPPS
jgi:hypothetical protein